VGHYRRCSVHERTARWERLAPRIVGAVVRAARGWRRAAGGRASAGRRRAGHARVVPRRRAGPKPRAESTKPA